MVGGGDVFSRPLDIHSSYRCSFLRDRKPRIGPYCETHITDDFETDPTIRSYVGIVYYVDSDSGYIIVGHTFYKFTSANLLVSGTQPLTDQLSVGDKISCKIDTNGIKEITLAGPGDETGSNMKSMKAQSCGWCVEGHPCKGCKALRSSGQKTDNARREGNMSNCDSTMERQKSKLNRSHSCVLDHVPGQKKPALRSLAEEFSSDGREQQQQATKMSSLQTLPRSRATISLERRNAVMRDANNVRRSLVSQPPKKEDTSAGQLLNRARQVTEDYIAAAQLNGGRFTSATSSYVMGLYSDPVNEVLPFISSRMDLSSVRMMPLPPQYPRVISADISTRRENPRPSSSYRRYPDDYYLPTKDHLNTSYSRDFDTGESLISGVEGRSVSSPRYPAQQRRTRLEWPSNASVPYDPRIDSYDDESNRAALAHYAAMVSRYRYELNDSNFPERSLMKPSRGIPRNHAINRDALITERLSDPKFRYVTIVDPK